MGFDDMPIRVDTDKLPMATAYAKRPHDRLFVDYGGYSLGYNPARLLEELELQAKCQAVNYHYLED